jgi:hypothetical protein
MQIPTIFYGWARAKENKVHTGPGETAQYKKAFETNGSAFSNAPGVAYTGTPADFLGQGVVTWSPYTPTPVPLRPACDNPPPVVLAGIGGPAWGGPGQPAPAPEPPLLPYLVANDGSTFLLENDDSTYLTSNPP